MCKRIGSLRVDRPHKKTLYAFRWGNEGVVGRPLTPKSGEVCDGELQDDDFVTIFLMEADEATGALNSLGLGAALGGMGFGDEDTMEGLRQMGLVGKRRIRAEELESGGFADEAASDVQYDDELEAGIDAELAEEERQAAEALATAQAQQAGTSRKFRGEDDLDFDEDNEQEAAVKTEAPSDNESDLFGDDPEYNPDADTDMDPQTGPLHSLFEPGMLTDANVDDLLVQQYYPAFNSNTTLNFTDLLAGPARDSKRKKAQRGPVSSW